MSKPFTAQEAYDQAKRDMERADEAVQWLANEFNTALLGEQSDKVRSFVLSGLHDEHVREGRLPPPGGKK